MTDLRSPKSLVNFAVYDGTGTIRRSGRCPLADVGKQALAGEHMIEGDAPWQSHYVDTSQAAHVAKPRPTFPAFDRLAIKADGKDAAVLDLPVAAKVTIDGVEHDAAADPLRFTADSPGHYSIELAAWPYLPARFVVVAA